MSSMVEFDRLVDWLQSLYTIREIEIVIFADPELTQNNVQLILHTSCSQCRFPHVIFQFVHNGGTIISVASTTVPSQQSFHFSATR